MLKKITAATFILLAAGTGMALADDDCHVPMNQWQPREAVQKMARSLGWDVHRIRIDDGCYQIRGLDETGKRFKAKIDPATLEIVKIKRKDRRDDDGWHDGNGRGYRDGRGNGRGNQGAGKQGAGNYQNNMGPTGNSAPSKLFEPGKPPAAVVR